MRTPTPEELATLALLRQAMEYHGQVYRDSCEAYWAFHEEIHGEPVTPDQRRAAKGEEE